MGEQIPIAVRPAKPEDEAFILSTWLRCYKHSSSFGKRIHPRVFFPEHRRRLEMLLAGPCQVLVAHPPSDPDVILGYAAWEPGRRIIHWVYVKEAWRRLGIATALLQPMDPNSCEYTHETWKVWAVKSGHPNTGDTDDLLRKWPDAEYNPYPVLGM